MKTAVPLEIDERISFNLESITRTILLFGRKIGTAFLMKVVRVNAQMFLKRLNDDETCGGVSLENLPRT